MPRSFQSAICELFTALAITSASWPLVIFAAEPAIERSITTSEFTLVAEPAASKRLQLKERLKDLFSSWIYDRVIKDRYLLVRESDAHIEGDLRLDFDAGWAADDQAWRKLLNVSGPVGAQGSVPGVIVIGDLSVDGSIINASLESGVFVYVTGDVTCTNLVAGGAHIVIGGALHAKNAVYAHYNDGSLKIGGDLSCRYFVSEDHMVSHDNVTADYYYNSHSYEIPEDVLPLEDEKTGSALIPPRLTRLLDPPAPKLFDQLLRDLCEDPPSVEKNADYWLAKVRRHWDDASRIPPEHQSPAIYEAAFEECALAIQYFPDSMLNDELYRRAVTQLGVALEFVPEEKRSRELCMIAAENRTSLEYIPEYLKNDDELLAAVVAGNPWQIGRVPPARVTKEMMADYVRGGDAWQLESYCRALNFNMEDIALMVVRGGLKDVESIPGFAFSATVFAEAEQLYANGKTADHWNSIKSRHIPEFWRSFNPKYVREQIEPNPLHKMRFNGGFTVVWQVFWDEEFCLNVIKHGDGAEQLELIPAHARTLDICRAAVARWPDAIEEVPLHMRPLVR